MSNQLSIPAQNRIWFGHSSHFFESLAAQPMTDFGQRGPARSASESCNRVLIWAFSSMDRADTAGPGRMERAPVGSPISAGVFISLAVTAASVGALTDSRKLVSVQFSERLISGDFTYNYALDAGDLDGDGDQDLTVSNCTTRGSRQHNDLYWFENNGRAVDMDRDGDVDVVLATGFGHWVSDPQPVTQRVVWYENLTGKGSEWKRHVIYGPFDQAFDAVAGDLDRDGDFDVVATAWGDLGQIAWFENPGRADRAWVHHPLKQDWKGATQPIIVDLDRDGRLDIAATAEQSSLECRWWRNLGVPDQK